MTVTAKKVSVFGVIPVRIFSAFSRIEYGEIRSTDSFYAVCIIKKYEINIGLVVSYVLVLQTSQKII